MEAVWRRVKGGLMLRRYDADVDSLGAAVIAGLKQLGGEELRYNAKTLTNLREKRPECRLKVSIRFRTARRPVALLKTNGRPLMSLIKPPFPNPSPS